VTEPAAGTGGGRVGRGGAIRGRAGPRRETGAQAGPAQDRATSVLAVLGWIVSATTWLALIHLLAGLIIGLVAFVVIVAGIALGVGLLPVLGFGILLLVSTFWFGQQYARAERARFAFLLGEHIPAPRPVAAHPHDATGWRRIWRAATRATAWKNLAYALVRLPLSVLEVALVLTVWSASLVLLTAPAYSAALPGGAAHLGGFRLAGTWWLSLAAVTGVVLLIAAPVVTRAVAMMDTSAGRWLLGSAGRAELTARIGELETSRARVLDAAEAERMRIERDLHDGAQQRLVSLAMELGRAKAKFATDPQAAAAIVGQAHEQAKTALAELRNLVRGVRPPVLSDRGLDAALSGLAALSPVPVTVRADLPGRPPAAVEAIAYFVVAEALTNVAKHAGASHAEVTVGHTGGLLTVVISDDGIGGADPAGQGLSGLAARVAGVDGRLRVTSPAGGPTSVEVVLPCGS
jgi:signal transduction histidine kinase